MDAVCFRRILAPIGLLLIAPMLLAQRPPQGGRPGGPGGPGGRGSQGPATAEGASIQWYATLDRGLAEAKRTGKPILFVSAAPHCAGVSGMW